MLSHKTIADDVEITHFCSDLIDNGASAIESDGILEKINAETRFADSRVPSDDRVAEIRRPRGVKAAQYFIDESVVERADEELGEVEYRKRHVLIREREKRALLLQAVVDDSINEGLKQRIRRDP